MRTVLKFIQRASLALASGLHSRKERRIVELDERTLKDIGLEPWRSALGAEVAIHRHESRRWRAAHLGLY